MQFQCGMGRGGCALALRFREPLHVLLRNLQAVATGERTMRKRGNTMGKLSLSSGIVCSDA